MAEYNSLEKIRLQKLDELRAEGVEAYPTRATRTHTSAQAIAAFEAVEAAATEVKVTLAGRSPLRDQPNTSRNTNVLSCWRTRMPSSSRSSRSMVPSSSPSEFSSMSRSDSR